MAAQLSVEMTGDERKLAKKLVRAEANIDSLKEKLKEAGRAGKRSGSQITGSMKAIQKSMNALAGAAGLASIQQVLGGINQAYEVWLQNQRAIASEARKAGNELVALAALQEGGEIAARVRQADKTAGGYGIFGQRGEVFNVVQSLQSVLGSWEKGLEAAKTVFAATQLDVPMRYGLQLELVGASQGLAEGEAIRKAYVAGKLSGGSPKIISRAAPSLGVFDDPDFGFAAAAGIAASFSPEELPTFVRGLGIGLSSSSAPEFQKTYAELGVADGTRLERLRALYEAGIDTTDELAAAGLKEISQARALNKALQPQNIEIIENVYRQLPGLAVPGVLAEDRKRIEDEVPQAKMAREMALLQAMMEHETAFGEGAVPAMELDIQQRKNALALRTMGQEQFGWWDLIGEDGRSSNFAYFLGALRGILSEPSRAPDDRFDSRLLEAMWDINEELRDINKNTMQTASNGKRASERRPRINPDAQNE